MTTQGPVQLIAELFASEGAAEYLGEPVTQAAHMLQAATLSPASVYTLRVQGGPMRDAEAREFAASPYGQAACQLRRLAVGAKQPGAATPPFDHFRPLLASLVRAGYG